MVRVAFPLEARRHAALGIALVATLALAAAAVRTLPLLAAPDVPAAAAWVFGRAAATMSLEVAVAVGWPVGWALAAAALAERGEVRVLASLGLSPADVLRRLAPQSVVFAGALFALSWATAADAQAPGRLLAGFVASSRASCVAAPAPSVAAVPLLGAHWLCPAGAAPRLFLPLPKGALATATAFVVADDLREVTLADATVALGGGGGRGDAARAPTLVRAGELRLRRLPPIVASAHIGPLARALTVVSAALVAAFLATRGVLRGTTSGRLAALAASGIAALSGLGAVRLLDRLEAKAPLLALAPLAAAAAAALVGGAATFAHRVLLLRQKRATASH